MFRRLIEDVLRNRDCTGGGGVLRKSSTSTTIAGCTANTSWRWKRREAAKHVCVCDKPLAICSCI